MSRTYSLSIFRVLGVLQMDSMPHLELIKMDEIKTDRYIYLKLFSPHIAINFL